MSKDYTTLELDISKVLALKLQGKAASKGYTAKGYIRKLIRESLRESDDTN